MPSVAVTFDWNYADEGEMSPIIVREGEMVIMPENGFTRNGYSFSGWNTKMDGSGVAIKDAEEIDLFKAVEGKDAVLYAQWEAGCTEVTINHPAETEQVWVVDVPAHDEPIYEVKTVCNTCGQAMNTVEEFYQHTLGDLNSPCFNSGYGDRPVQTGTKHVDEAGHYETVIIKEAWTETKQVCA